MSRSASESSWLLVPPCAMQVPPLQAVEKDGTATELPANVEFAEFAKSTWNFQRLSELVPKFAKTFGAPAGGASVDPVAAVAPSRSDGSRPPKLLERLKHWPVAAAPASIAARSNAQAAAPLNETPLRKRLKVM